MSVIPYTVDTDEYFQGFVKSTSMKPLEAIKEWEQNIKKASSLDQFFHVKFFNNNKELIKIDVNKRFSVNNINEIAYISIDDNSNKPMTPKNAQDMMVSLMKTDKSGGIGCFNFGEILGGYVLTGTCGYILYNNKCSNETWKVTFGKGKCPIHIYNYILDFYFEILCLNNSLLFLSK